MTEPTGPSAAGRDIPADYGIPQLSIPNIPGITDVGRGTSSTPAKKRSLAPEKVRPALVTIGVLLGLMIVVQIFNSLASGWNLNAKFGIIPRSVGGLDGILFAPLLHGNWAHLLGNAVPLVIFGLLLFAGGVRQFVVVTVLVWLVSGIGVWVIGDSNSVTIGASGVVFGWLAYLVARGIFTRNIGQILVGLVLLVLWGGTLWSGIIGAGVKDFLGYSGISWQAHLFGAIGGVLAAFLVARADGPRRAAVSA
ncbi:MAG: rhomboid family intramembrane serine protease [Nakamurella sp.]